MSQETEKDFIIIEKYPDHFKIIILRQFYSFTEIHNWKTKLERSPSPTFLFYRLGNRARGFICCPLLDTGPTCVCKLYLVIQKAKKEIQSFSGHNKKLGPISWPRSALSALRQKSRSRDPEDPSHHLQTHPGICLQFLGPQVLHSCCPPSSECS